MEVIPALPVEFEAQLQHIRVVVIQAVRFSQRGFSQGILTGVQCRPGEIKPAVQISGLQLRRLLQKGQGLFRFAGGGQCSAIVG